MALAVQLVAVIFKRIHSNVADHLGIACVETASFEAQIQMCHNNSNNNKIQNKSESNEEKDNKKKATNQWQQHQQRMCDGLCVRLYLEQQVTNAKIK